MINEAIVAWNLLTEPLKRELLMSTVSMNEVLDSFSKKMEYGILSSVDKVLLDITKMKIEESKLSKRHKQKALSRLAEIRKDKTVNDSRRENKYQRQVQFFDREHRRQTTERRALHLARSILALKPYKKVEQTTRKYNHPLERTGMVEKISNFTGGLFDTEEIVEWITNEKSLC